MRYQSFSLDMDDTKERDCQDIVVFKSNYFRREYCENLGALRAFNAIQSSANTTWPYIFIRKHYLNLLVTVVV